jgi:hypothetical protein
VSLGALSNKACVTSGATAVRAADGTALLNGQTTDDPTIRIQKFAEGEFHASTDDEIARFEQRWPLEARERLAFALFVFTGRRASDVARCHGPR